MIIADHVTRRFANGTIGVEDVSFQIGQGETVGIIGKNGAGKTTLLKMILGVLSLSEGRLWTMDRYSHIDKEDNRGKIGYMFAGQSQLFSTRTMKEAFEYQSILYHPDKKRYEELFEKVGKRMKLDEYYENSMGSLSLGQKRCGEFFAAIMFYPQLLVLDEPTIGMDEESREVLCDAIRYLNEEYKVTVLFAGHDLESMAKTCRRVLVMGQGKLLMDGEWELLRERSLAWCQAEYSSAKPIDLEDLPVHFMEYENGRTRLLFDSNKVSGAVLLEFLNSRGKIKDFSIKEPEMERIVCQILKGGI